MFCRCDYEWSHGIPKVTDYLTIIGTVNNWMKFYFCCFKEKWQYWQRNYVNCILHKARCVLSTWKKLHAFLSVVNVAKSMVTVFVGIRKEWLLLMKFLLMRWMIVVLKNSICLFVTELPSITVTYHIYGNIHISIRNYLCKLSYILRM